MKCKSCGGIITFKNGQGKCESCGALHNIDYFFENTEVFLCYVENDSAGRRTKDSFIASDIYDKLEAKKVNTFFERISADNTIGEDLEAVRYQAITKANIIVVIGTTKEHYEKLQKKYTDYYQDKTIIPVYSGIKPELLPDELKKLQALNYDSIGSTVDLVKTVLKKLGREEAELETIRKDSKKKKVILLSILAFLLVAAAVVFFVWFSQNKKPENDVSGENESAEQTEAPETEEPIQNRYDRAVSLLESGNYTEALSELKLIRGFRDSEDLIKTTYNKYSGYYQTEDLNSSLYLNIKDGKSAEIQFEQLSNGVRASFADTVLFDDNVIDLIFNDSFGKAGKATITLGNQTIRLIAKSNEEAAGGFVWDTDLTFNLSDRTDRPLEKEVTKEIIMQWMRRQTTVSEIIQDGFIVESDGRGYSAGGGDFKWARSYIIKNSNVRIFCLNYDLKKVTDLSDIPDFDDIQKKDSSFDDLIIYGVIAPAELILPDKIGNSVSTYVYPFGIDTEKTSTRACYDENSILYVPFVERFAVGGAWVGHCVDFERLSWDSNEDNTTKTIESDTSVGMTSGNIIGEINYTFLKRNMTFEDIQIGYYRDDLVDDERDILIKENNQYIVIKGYGSNYENSLSQTYSTIFQVNKNEIDRLDFYGVRTEYGKQFYDYRISFKNGKQGFISTLMETDSKFRSDFADIITFFDQPEPDNKFSVFTVILFDQVSPSELTNPIEVDHSESYPQKVVITVDRVIKNFRVVSLDLDLATFNYRSAKDSYKIGEFGPGQQLILSFTNYEFKSYVGIAFTDSNGKECVYEIHIDGRGLPVLMEISDELNLTDLDSHETSAETKAAAGTYTGTKYKFNGDEEWGDNSGWTITLNVDGTAKSKRDGEEYDAEWSLEDDKFTFKEKFMGIANEYTGAYKDGKLEFYNGAPESEFACLYKFAK